MFFFDEAATATNIERCYAAHCEAQGAAAANRRSPRVPGGHSEGYLEAVANIYVEAAAAISAAQGGLPLPANVFVPTVEDGVKGGAFIDAAVRSSRSGTETF